MFKRKISNKSKTFFSKIRCVYDISDCFQTFQKSCLCVHVVILYTQYILINEKYIMWIASEWQGSKSSLRCVILVPNSRNRQLEVKNQLGHLIRAIDFPFNTNVLVYIYIYISVLYACVHSV